MAQKQIVKWIAFTAVAYFGIGILCYITGYLENWAAGKQIVFSPIVGLPLTVIGWPQMVIADLAHYQTLGVRWPALIAVLALAVLVTIAFKRMARP